ncbi:MAG TPA: DUF4333 domain-containing protein [Mycobacterium sp.]|jgi:hypothetical protein
MAEAAARMLVALWLLVFLSVAACSFGPHIVTRKSVAEQVAHQMTDAAGHKPEAVVCPNDLQPTVGASVTCTMTLGGKPASVKVTVTGIEGDNAKLDMQIVKN